jgi:predicted transcriptional regulator of viral defense system
MKYVTIAIMNAMIVQNITKYPIKATDVVSWLLSRGICAVTTEELAVMLCIPEDHVRQRMAPIIKRNEIISPARGLWVPVPYEYRLWGAPEAIYYIDHMMSYLETDYYIGWLSAADILGASHHAPQVFQVAVSKAVSNREIGRSRIQFYKREIVSALPVFRHKTQTGFVKVSSRAATMLSAANDMSIVSGPDNAANIIIELSETDEDIIREIAACADKFPISALRRVGWILERFTDYESLDVLAEVSQHSDVKLSKLFSHNSYSNRIDKRWSLDINERIEPDV